MNAAIATEPVKPPPWPRAVRNVGSYVPPKNRGMTNIAALPAKAKRAWWARIEAVEPGLAAFLTDVGPLLKDEFGVREIWAGKA